MWEDPIVKEVRQARLEIEQDCDSDFRKIYERALEIQKKSAAQRIAAQKERDKQLPIAA